MSDGVRLTVKVRVRVSGCDDRWCGKWEMLGAHSGAAEDSGLLGCDAVSLGE